MPKVIRIAIFYLLRLSVYKNNISFLSSRVTNFIKYVCLSLNYFFFEHLFWRYPSTVMLFCYSEITIVAYCILYEKLYLLPLLFIAHLNECSGYAIVITLCPLSVVVRRQQLVCQLSRGHSFEPNLNETCSECLSLWKLDQVRDWVTWEKNLGQLVKSKEDLVNTLEVTFC